MDDDILKGYNRSSIPWKIPHYGSHPGASTTSNKTITPCPDIKFVNYILDNDGYKYNNSVHKRSAANSNGDNVYMESDAVLEFNSMMRDSHRYGLRGSTIDRIDKNVSPLSRNRYKYKRTRSAPVLNSQVCNGNGASRPDRVDRVDSVVSSMSSVSSASLQMNHSKQGSTARVRYNPRKYMEEEEEEEVVDASVDTTDGSVHGGDGYIPKDMEMDLERLLSCDTVDAMLLSSQNGPPVTSMPVLPLPMLPLPTLPADPVSSVLGGDANTANTANTNTANRSNNNETDVFALLGDAQWDI